MIRAELESETLVWESRAPAKVNLALAVLGRRADGYHELRSVFLRLDLADSLTLATQPGAPGARDELIIEGDDDCPVDGNLVLQAIDRFRAACAGAAVPRMRAVLTKRIPMAAGLAGGSSDAATTLRSLAACRPGALTTAHLAGIAARLGADVPFFLDGAGAALVGGLGDEVEPLPPPIEPVGVLLVRPAFGSSTPLVFGAWDALAARSAGDADEAVATGTMRAVDDLAHLLRTGASPGDLVALAAALRDANDLWHPAVSVTPQLATLRRTLEELLDRPVLMTGSGSTLFALYPDLGAAERAAEALRAAPTFHDARVMATASSGMQPPPISSRRNP